MSIHCIIHREALVAKKLGNEEENHQLADDMTDVIKIVKTILKSSTKSR